MNDFLRLEYEQCMSLVRHYDERHHSLMKFAAGLSSGVLSFLLGIYGLGDSVLPLFWDIAGLVFFITMVGLTTILAAIVQTRLYFVYPARQLNAIRKNSLRKVVKEFRDNQMYLDTTFSAFKWTSSHTIQQAMVALQIGFFGGLAVFAWSLATLDRTENIFSSLIVAIIVAASTFLGSASYLRRKSQYHPDKAIHQSSG